MDIMKFFFLYVLVLFAFSSGLNQLLWYLLLFVHFCNAKSNWMHKIEFLGFFSLESSVPIPFPLFHSIFNFQVLCGFRKKTLPWNEYGDCSERFSEHGCHGPQCVLRLATICQVNAFVFYHCDVFHSFSWFPFKSFFAIHRHANCKAWIFNLNSFEIVSIDEHLQLNVVPPLITTFIYFTVYSKRHKPFSGLFLVWWT